MLSKTSVAGSERPDQFAYALKSIAAKHRRQTPSLQLRNSKPVEDVALHTKGSSRDGARI